MALDTESTSSILFITSLLNVALIRTAAMTTSNSHSSPDQDRSNDNVEIAFVPSPDQDRSNDNVEIAFVSWSGPQRRHSQNHIRSTNWQESYLPEARIMKKQPCQSFYRPQTQLPTPYDDTHAHEQKKLQKRLVQFFRHTHNMQLSPL